MILRPANAALVAATLLGSACGSAQQSALQTTPAPARTQVQPDSAYVAKARADSARHPYTMADVEFMTNMIGHHAQAIEMARLVPSRNASPAVQRLADRIINAQEDEIVTMQTWLRDRLKPVPDADHGASTMMMEGHQHDMLMPGMLTPAQMATLTAASGPAFDRLFLEGMIQHHTGAVEMVGKLFGSYGAGQDETIFKFASDVNVDQATEIARMESMLQALPAETPAP